MTQPKQLKQDLEANNLKGECNFCKHERCPKCNFCHNMDCTNFIKPQMSCWDLLKPESPDKCGCACHKKRLNGFYQHDTKCCENMNGFIPNNSVESWEDEWDKKFFKFSEIGAIEHSD